MCYFSNALKHPAITINVICHALQDPKFNRVDFIVRTGISGLLLLVPVSLQSGIPCGAIRKSFDANSEHCNGGSHSGCDIEYEPHSYKANRYVIIDDLIDSGKTIKYIIETMTKMFPHSQCTGIILYQNWKDTQPKKWDNVPVTHLIDDISELNKLTNQRVC